MPEALKHLLCEQDDRIGVAGQLLVDLLVINLVKNANMSIASIIDEDRDVNVTKVIIVNLLINLCLLRAFSSHIEHDDPRLDLQAYLVTDLLNLLRSRVEFLQVARDQDNVEAFVRQMLRTLFTDSICAACDYSPRIFPVSLSGALDPEKYSIEDFGEAYGPPGHLIRTYDNNQRVQIHYKFACENKYC